MVAVGSIAIYLTAMAVFQVSRLHEEIDTLHLTLAAQDTLRKQTHNIVREELSRLQSATDSAHSELGRLQAAVLSSQENTTADAKSSVKYSLGPLSYQVSNIAFGKRPPIRPEIESEIWANRETWGKANEVVKKLSDNEVAQIKALCGRCLYGSLTKAVVLRGLGDDAHVKTGDIPEMWIRDSAVQISVYLGHIKEHPAFRPVIEGAIRRNAFNILQDPYANAFYMDYRKPSSLTDQEQDIGRGGWVGTRNFEVDSGAYFFNLLWNYYSSPNLMYVESFLGSSLIFDAVNLMVNIWVIEQKHEELSTYRYIELPRDGLGNPVGYTGMIWTGFRPSDDPTKYHYNIPVNMYAAGALQKILELNEHVWGNEDLQIKVAKLLKEVRGGIKKFGSTKINDQVIYAYEVDGLGGVLAPFDDANLPSILSIPLLGFDGYDKKIYENTRKWLLSPSNPQYFSSAQTGLKGVGSPHTPAHHLWPLSLAVQGLTSNDVQERADLLKMLLKCQGSNGLMHESVHVENPSVITREWFEWANAMFVVFAETSTGVHCNQEAESARLDSIRKNKNKNPAYYSPLEAQIQYD